MRNMEINRWSWKENTMAKHMYWAWALKNSITIVCWTILAIYFNKWWIALLAALFLSSISTKNEKDDEDGN